jgi:hypothetical protein
MPMLGFLYEARLCLYDEFREGNASPAAGQVGFYKECKERMPEGKRIARYRADSASYQAELINILDKDRVKFTITADQDTAVKKVIKSIPEEEWERPDKECDYEIAVTVHSMNDTKKAFTLVIKREVVRETDLFEKEDERYRYYVIATNYEDEERDAKSILLFHNGRGDAENFNKELKIGLGMERMPSGQSHANAVFFRIGVIAYNLFIGFKRLTCPESWLRQTIATLRWKMIQVAGRIVRHAGQVILKIATGIDKLNIFKGIRSKIYEISLCLDG